MDEVLAAAASVRWSRLGDRGLCDACLGRLFGKLGHGFTNPQRGRAVRDAHPIARTLPCWLCQGLLEEVPKFAEMTTAKLAPFEYRTFLIGSKVEAEIAAREEALWTDLALSHAEPLKAELNREVGKLVGAMTGKEVDFRAPEVNAIVDTQFDVVEVTLAPLFIHGRYRKLSREIPQTRWPCRRCQGKGCERCGGVGKMYPTSVEEIVAKDVLLQTGGTGHALHGMGREDVDALMLGSGRPFVLEISKPRRRAVDLAKVASVVNGSGLVEVTGLRPSSWEEVLAVKEDRADKTYRARIRFSDSVDPEKVKEGLLALANAHIAQRTPTRVSHRRADKVRHRVVKDATLVLTEGREAEVLVTAEAGTYVKELLHGDEGRTVPSLAGILAVPCEVLALDVVEVRDAR